MRDSCYHTHAALEDTYWWFVGKNRLVLSLVDRFIPKVDRPRILEVGCGTGGLLARLAQRGDAVGVDPSPLALQACDNRGLEAREAYLPDRIPFPPGSFDVVVASEVIEHVEDDRASVRALVDLLSPGGLLVLTVPAFQWLWSRHDTANHHHRRYTTRRLASLLDGLDTERLVLSYSNFAAFPAMAASRIVSKALARSDDTADARIRPLPAFINVPMRELFALEGRIIPHVRLPFGGSVAGAWRRIATRHQPASPPASADVRTLRRDLARSSP